MKREQQETEPTPEKIKAARKAAGLSQSAAALAFRTAFETSLRIVPPQHPISYLYLLTFDRSQAMMIPSTDGGTEMDTMGSYSFLGELSAEEYQELKDEINAPWPEEEQQ